MSLRTPVLLAAVAALFASLLAALPAEAAGRSYVVVSTRNIALKSDGTGKVAVSCRSRTNTCKGKISFSDDTNPPRVRSYKVPRGRTAYVAVALRPGGPDDPYRAPEVAGRDYKSVSDVRLKVDEDFPSNTTHYYSTMTTETEVTRQDIRGRVQGQGTLATDIRVDLMRTVRGGNVEVLKGEDLDQGDEFRFSVNLGANNSSSSPYLLRVSGRDQDGKRRSWYWRGSDNKPSGGGAHLREASVVRATKHNDFDADVRYGSISGNASTGTEITVASPPAVGGGATTLRELDIQNCANIFGQTTAEDGTYTVAFLPMTTSTSNRYMVGGRLGSTNAWYGAGTARYGSCHDATNYTRSRDNLITLTSPLVGKPVNVSPSGNTITINGVFSPAYKPTAQGDRWITIREKIPGLAILDAPVVAEGMGNASGNRTFGNLPPGNFYVEVGRRTGCSTWQPSRFSNNRAYFKGADRYAENWKSFRRLRDLPGNATSGLERTARTADPNPARGTVQNSVPRGYAGWMYRGYCKAYGTGTVNTMSINGTGVTYTKTTTRNGRGAVVKGRVTRTGGRTNKEIMVRLSSSAGTRVIRTDLTDGSGTFYVAGLPSGRWTISVNSDSWRGIKRGFTGRHSVTVKANRGYNVGTLRFNG